MKAGISIMQYKHGGAAPGSRPLTTVFSGVDQIIAGSYISCTCLPIQGGKATNSVSTRTAADMALYVEMEYHNRVRSYSADCQSVAKMNTDLVLFAAFVCCDFLQDSRTMRSESPTLVNIFHESHPLAVQMIDVLDICTWWCLIMLMFPPSSVSDYMCPVPIWVSPGCILANNHTETALKYNKEMCRDHGVKIDR